MAINAQTIKNIRVAKYEAHRSAQHPITDIAPELSTAEFVDAAGSAAAAAGSAASEAAVAAQSRRHIGMHVRDSLVVAARAVAFCMQPGCDSDADKPVWQSCAAPRSRSPAGKGRKRKVGKGGKGNLKNAKGDK